ncbi:hypothetical protein ABFV05_017085 [Capra hircus]
MLALSYQGISQQPGGNEKFSWKDITLIVFGTGTIVIIIIACSCCHRNRYNEQGSHQGRSDQLLQTPDALVAENEVLQNKLGKLQDENGKLKDENGELQNEIGKLHTENGKLHHENGKLHAENGKLKDENDKRKAQYKHAWKNVPLYPDWRKEEFKAVNMTLDAATAHPALLLSEEGRRVSWQESM